VVHLRKVFVAFELKLLDFSLLNRSFGEKSSAEELVLLINSLKENICDATGAFIPPVGQERHLDVHDDDFGRQLAQALSGIVQDDLLGFIHARIALDDKSFIFLRILNVECGIFKQLSQFEFLSTHRDARFVKYNLN